jgi:hypothetical protein
VRAVVLGLGGAIAGVSAVQGNGNREGSVDWAGAWLGHVQHI